MADLREFTQLEKLHLSRFPSTLLLPQSLVDLSLTGLTNFDFSSISEFVRLKTISIGANNLVSSRVDLKRFRNLEDLWLLGSNKISLGCFPVFSKKVKYHELVQIKLIFCIPDCVFTSY
jgi:hypothetical protein